MDVQSNSPKSRELCLQPQQYHHPTVNQNERQLQERGFPHCADSVNPGEKIETGLLKSVPFVGSTFSTDLCQNLLYLEDDSSNTVNRFFAEAYACGLDPAPKQLGCSRYFPLRATNGTFTCNDTRGYGTCFSAGNRVEDQIERQTVM
ncbi:hypothetical protein MLD38_020659 [Melastoma candidum]|uniref:Uncharacterized protein n=1 Tax=Melastoma candidum TaxID=119954 RepID=A0ACB9QDP6_9MYRT|nr:hypothetical protein MLD38_020659 [Melastoma candidum]